MSQAKGSEQGAGQWREGSANGVQMELRGREAGAQPQDPERHEQKQTEESSLQGCSTVLHTEAGEPEIPDV